MLIWIMAVLVGCDAGGAVLGEAPAAGLQLQEIAYSCAELEEGVVVPGLDAAIWHVEACGDGVDRVWQCADIGQYARVRSEEEGPVLMVSCSSAGSWDSYTLRYLAP